ncbi:MAG: transcription antitermination protein NusB [Micavibrio aeruginosavorus]|uniref:Transcription antitermination protein NusB n=1 Tax=Micavibrio aeruginosavorus TaxID=349221 RepID=A0A2W5MSF1_9BACT|nr:MAG: transcription antitermination protein NusB [Micavibrio aeruginosavorus]
MNEPAVQKSHPNAMRSAARLMAVQAVYQILVNRKEAALVVDEYLHLRQNMEFDGETMVAPDESLFRDIVLGVAERFNDLKEIVEANRPLRDGQIRVSEPLLEAVFLCGACELLNNQHIDFALIISGYVDVAKAFFAGNEPSLVNAVLDSIRKVTRP